MCASAAKDSTEGSRRHRMTEDRCSKPLRFARLMMKFTSIPLYFERLDSEKNLKRAFFEMRMSDIDTPELSHFMQSVLPHVDQEVLDEGKSEWLRELRITLQEENDDIFVVLLNQALVLCCAILDSFLDDCLRMTMPLSIVFLETEKDIDSLTEILDEGGTGDEYEERMQEKIFKKFQLRSGIKGKAEMFKTIGVDFDAAITFQHKWRPKSIQYSKDDAYNFLVDAYEKRHIVAHGGHLPLNTYADLEAISEFFSELMMNIAIIMRDKSPYGLRTDLDMMTLADTGSIDLDDSPFDQAI